MIGQAMILTLLLAIGFGALFNWRRNQRRTPDLRGRSIAQTKTDPGRPRNWRQPMSSPTRIAVVVLWLSSLLAVGTLASGQLYGFDPLANPYVLSGGDMGFRVEGVIKDTPAGRLVIRGMDGQWVEPIQCNTGSRFGCGGPLGNPPPPPPPDLPR